MAAQLSTRVRNARLDATETAIGVSPTMEIRTGAQPANCAAADSGTVVSTIALPANWMADAAGAVKAMSGTWEDAAADNNGTAAHFRIKAADLACDFQGSVSLTGGGGDLQLDSVSFTAGQDFKVTQFTWNEPNG